MSTRTVEVRQRLRSTPEALFETLVDPSSFAGLRGVRSVKVLASGPGGPASVGTRRRVNLAVGYLVEEIVGLESPHQFDYVLREASLPFEHLQGRIEFLGRGDYTEAVWSSTFAFHQPLVAPVLARIAAAGARAAFVAALRELDRAAAHRSNEEDR